MTQLILRAPGSIQVPILRSNPLTLLVSDQESNAPDLTHDLSPLRSETDLSLVVSADGLNLTGVVVIRT